MGELALKRATYEDLCRVPDNLVAEILFGRLVTHPRPAPRHARAASVLGGKIGDQFDFGDDGPGGWIILVEPEIHLGDHVVVPDLVGWRRENLPQLPETAWFETPPDWVCEVLPPKPARHDRFEKRAIYASFKVRHLWLVDPDAQTVETFELREKAAERQTTERKWLLLATYAGNSDIAAAPFAEAPFNLKPLWSY